MNNESDQEKERLKEEYKDHYRRIKEAKARLKSVEQKGKITQALNNMNADSLLSSVDEYLGKVKDRVNLVEAKLDVAMDGLDDEDSSVNAKIVKQELDDELKKSRAKETLQQVKAEMGMLYSEIEKHAEGIKSEKTVGLKKSNNKDDSTSSTPQ